MRPSSARSGRRVSLCLAIVTMLAATEGSARQWYVAPGGDDTVSGTEAAPLATVAEALRRMRPGDQCLLRGGVYREEIVVTQNGSAENPLVIAAAPDEEVVLDGADPLKSDWQRDTGAIYRAQVERPVRQLFCDGQLLVEAQWPNMKPLSAGGLWNLSRWANAGEGSRYGEMVDPQLARLPVSLTGAVATLNVAHQFFTWTRTIRQHSRGRDRFTYDQDLQGITHYADKTTPWEDDRYYIRGKRELLDAPGEWFYDTATSTLYLWLPDGSDPASHEIRSKQRAYAVRAKGVDHVQLRGLRLQACTWSIVDGNHWTIEDCHVAFPTANRRLDDPEADEFDAAITTVQGDDNRVYRCSLSYGPGTALLISGRRNTVDDCLMHDFCWDGSLSSPLLVATSPALEPAADRCSIRHCTLFNSGNAIINYRGFPGHIIEYNHVYQGGLCCEDVALVYTGQPTAAGSVVRYNWVHGCRTQARLKSVRGELSGGLGIRGDDQTRQLTVHHNVVWDCGRDGIIVKGDGNLVFNNTVLDIGTPSVPGNYIDMHVEAEPAKWWRQQYPLLEVQNRSSLIANNVALTITGHQRGTPYPFTENLRANFQGDDPQLVDPARMDFRPRPGSPLIDAGVPVKGFEFDHAGSALDIGAYEHGKPAWKPGITW